jgi:hypothetical protein
MGQGLVVLLVAALLALVASSSAAASRRVALVIGNGDYSGAARLYNPPSDARDIGRALESAGFSVQHVLNADRQTLSDSLAAFGGLAARSELAVVFFAGHGLQVGDQNYLIPVGGRLDAELTVEDMVSLDEVLGAMQGAVSRVVILDACRNNPFVSRAPGQSRTDAPVALGVRARGLAGINFSQRTGHGPTLVAFATAPGSVAEDGIGSNSPFTAALKQHIATPGIDVREVFARVRKKVVEDTQGRQVPWDNSSLMGMVYFVDPTTGVLLVTIRRPESAQVWLDDQLRGEGSTEIRGIPRGKSILRVQAPGYLTYEQAVSIQAGMREEVTVSLRRDGAAGNVLQQLNRNRQWCCDQAGSKVCLMPSGGRTDVPCVCPGRDFVGQVCR